jgi:hypothetical protein
MSTYIMIVYTLQMLDNFIHSFTEKKTFNRDAHCSRFEPRIVQSPMFRLTLEGKKETARNAHLEL